MNPELQFPFPEPPEGGEMFEINENLRWIRMALPFALNHINLWLIRDTKGWTAVDSGIANDATRHCWNNILGHPDLHDGLNKVVITHYHPDHMGNASWLSKKMDAPVWISKQEFETGKSVHRASEGYDPGSVSRFFQLNGLPKDQADLAAQKGAHYPQLVDELPENPNTLKDKQTLDMGHAIWETMEGTGHSPEHMALFNASNKVLISGDMLLPKITTNVAVYPSHPASNPLAAFLQSIERFLSIPDSTLVLPSHGLPFYGISARVTQLKAHHEYRLARVAELCDTPKSAFEVLPALFDRELDAYQTFFAMGEAVAHLHYLWSAGELARVHGSDKKTLKFTKA
jgi:glyoxylase-like metal-dependent hydrolase (beta-lactamase superfamily II)